MHETSIVNSIMRTLELEFEAEKMERLKGIYVKVGILSNIDPRLLHNAYDAFHMTNPVYTRAELHIESTELKSQCELCNLVTKVKNYRFICENCGSPSKNVIQGEEKLIHKVEFND